jgi:hypothetical protein
LKLGTRSNRRTLLVPVRRLLECMGDLKKPRLIERPRHKLQSDGQRGAIF